LSLEDVSDSLQVSSVYLSKKFKEELGTSFVHVLSEIRMAKAIQLLDSTDITISKIAELVGFENQHYFSTSFKKIVGVSPIQYRQGYPSKPK
jgi:YesN/AraC family two-component response regulator